MLGTHAGGIVVQDAGSLNFCLEGKSGDLRDWSLSPPSEIAKTGNSPYKKIISMNNSMRMFTNTIQKNRRIWQTGYRKEF